MANDILKTTFNGKFKLGKFNLSAKEFTIPMIGRDMDNDDISNASAGEKSIISLALSLALARQTSTKYDIITIDELDGPLDTNKRRQFISILESQATSLGIEQMFAISHNDTFDDYPADVILLKGANIDTSCKNIVYEL